MGETGPQGPAGAGVASFDDLDGTTCRVGDPLEGVLEVTYGQNGAVSMACLPTALKELTVPVGRIETRKVRQQRAGWHQLR